MFQGPAYRDAEDLEQDIYQRIIEKISCFDCQTSKLPTWISRIGRNIQIDCLRRHKTASEAGSDCLTPPLPSDPEQRTALRAILNSLPERQQQVTRLRLKGLDLKEIAAHRGISVGQVSKDLKKAQEALLAATG
jgi:RNA polymerase sigma-70 factor (ECF subfamily)